MARLRYRLLADTPELKKRAILEEECDDGDQGFKCIDHTMHSDVQEEGRCTLVYNRSTVTAQPAWFEEVNLLYLTMSELKKIQSWLSSKKGVTK